MRTGQCFCPDACLPCCAKRLVDFVETLHQQESWVGTVSSGVYTHLRVRYEAKLAWDMAFLNPERLSTYCTAIHQNGEAPGLILGFLHGTHQPVASPENASPEAVTEVVAGVAISKWRSV